jgi:hypothetical protein
MTSSLVFYPYKLHILRLLINIEEQSRVYIPGIYPVCLEIVSNPAFSKSISQPKSINVVNKDKLKAFDLAIELKIPQKDMIKSQLFRE